MRGKMTGAVGGKRITPVAAEALFGRSFEYIPLRNLNAALAKDLKGGERASRGKARGSHAKNWIGFTVTKRTHARLVSAAKKVGVQRAVLEAAMVRVMVEKLEGAIKEKGCGNCGYVGV